MNYYELLVASVNPKILCHKITQLNSIIRIMAFSNILCHNKFSANAAILYQLMLVMLGVMH